VPIIPVAIVGAEEIHPVLGKVTKLAQPLGLPYIPITPTFPLLGPFGLLPSLAGGPGDPHRFRPEVGLFWETAPEQRGRGFATEAARALIGHALSALELQRLVATTEHDNLASIAVMRKLGMRIETNPEGEPEWFQTVGILEAG